MHTCLHYDTTLLRSVQVTFIQPVQHLHQNSLMSAIQHQGLANERFFLLLNLGVSNQHIVALSPSHFAAAGKSGFPAQA